MNRIRAQVQLRQELEGHREAIYTLAPAIDSKHFFTAGGDGVVAEWSAQLGKHVRAVLQAGAPVYALGRAKYKDIDWLFVGTNAGGIHFIDLTNNRLVKSVSLHKGGIYDFVWLVRESKMIAVSADGSFSVWELETCTCVLQAKVSAQSIRTTVVSPNGEFLVLAGSDNLIRVYDTHSLKAIDQWEAHLSSVFSLAWDSQTGHLLSAGRDARLKNWKAEPGFALQQEVVAHLFAINDIQMQPKGAYFATASMDKTIKLWRREDLKLIKVIDHARNKGHFSSVNRLLWLEEGRILVSVSDDRRVLVWQIDFREEE